MDDHLERRFGIKIENIKRCRMISECSPFVLVFEMQKNDEQFRAVCKMFFVAKGLLICVVAYNCANDAFRDFARRGG